MFDPLAGEPIAIRSMGGGDSWNFSLVLKNTMGEMP
jgi:hypothetical protein